MWSERPRSGSSRSGARPIDPGAHADRLGCRAGRRILSSLRSCAPTRRHRCPMTDALEVRGLPKTFGVVVAVDTVTFSAAAGSTMGLLGGNGACQTTTISQLLGQMTTQ